MSRGLKILLVVYCMCLHLVSVQQTYSSSATSCQYLDDESVFSVEILKNRQQLPCSTGTGVSGKDVKDLCDDQASTLGAAMSEMLGLQSDVNKLLETTDELTGRLLKMEQEFTKIQMAFKDPTYGLSSSCPPGYHVRSDDLGSCYMFVKREHIWHDALVVCTSTKGHLAAVETHKEQQYLINYITSSTDLSSQHFWLGGNDLAAEGTWLWAGKGTAVNYTQWLMYPHPEKGLVQQPDNEDGLEYCMHMFHTHNYEWSDSNCFTVRYYFICEYELP